MRRSPFFVAVALLLCAGSLAHAQTRPLLTEEATTASTGTLVFETAFAVIASEPSFVTGVERTRWDGPLLRLVYSPADRVELDLEWVAAVGVTAGGGEPRVSDAGDVTLRTKLRFFQGTGRHPTVSGRFGVALPQTSYDDENFRPLALGPNTLRFYVEALLTQPLGPVRVDVNAGLYLHDDPMRPHEQRDFFVYGLAARWALHPAWEIVGEVAGRAGKGSPGADERSEARLGARYRRGRWRFDAVVRRGLLQQQGTWGATAGLTWWIRSPS